MKLTGQGGGTLLNTKPRFHLQNQRAAGEIGILSRTHKALIEGKRSAVRGLFHLFLWKRSPARNCSYWNQNETDPFLKTGFSFRDPDSTEGPHSWFKAGSLPSDLELKALSPGPLVSPLGTGKLLFSLRHCFLVLSVFCLIVYAPLGLSPALRLLPSPRPSAGRGAGGPRCPNPEQAGPLRSAAPEPESESETETAPRRGRKLMTALVRPETPAEPAERIPAPAPGAEPRRKAASDPESWSAPVPLSRPCCWEMLPRRGYPQPSGLGR